MQAKGYRMVRYADDFVVLCRSAEEAEAALAEVKAWVAANGLSLNPEKTHVGDCRQAGQGFEFLGYRFEAGRRWVRPKSLKALASGSRMKTRRTRGDSLAKIIADLNPMLRGWFGYFKHAHPLTRSASTVLSVDGCARSCASRRSVRASAMSRRPSALAQCLLRNTGLFTMNGLCAGEPIPMRKPPTGEPCAGEPPARFGGRGGESLPDPYQANWRINLDIRVRRNECAHEGATSAR